MMNRKLMTALGALAMVAFAATAFAQPGQVFTPVKVATAARFAHTMPLRDMQYMGLPPILRRVIGDRAVSLETIAKLREKLVRSGLLRPLGSHIVLPLDRKQPALKTLRRVHDPALQAAMPTRQPNDFATPGLGFDGLGVSTGSSPGFTPPDNNAAVGQNYIVEGVNVEFAVYNKSDGSLAMGPMDITNLWSTMGGDCLNDGVSDPVINYDQMAHRWLISQITTNGSPNYHCIAISQTDDPTGAYYVYAFDITPNLPDYPKVGVWPGSYTVTFNEFGSSFNGVDFVAYDSAAMQNGDPGAQMVEFTSPNAYSDLPVEVDGSDMPPAGSPALFVNYISPNLFGGSAPYGVDFWSLSVDWSNPSAASLTEDGILTVDPFTDIICGGDRTCIPQASSSQTLDAITDRMMFRAVYRNFGDHQAIVAMHTVGADSSGNPPTGERWYEFRAPSGTTSGTAYSVYQQGTFAPADGNSRWMGSIAFDHVGNLALGYSVSGPSQDPEIAYTGRHAGDPAGQMTQPETVLQAAGGADTGSYARWGDYTSMQIDPTDDCTFWYTNQYWASPGDSFSWSTHIGSMKFANCTIGPQGTLAGTVTDAGTGSPIAGATITITPGNIVTQTASDGTYSILLPVGSYTVDATDFGYQAGSASVTITDSQTTTQDFQLTAAPTATISGNVTDGSGHGYGLYAEIKITTAGFGQVADVWTNPTTGAYSVDLPIGSTYAMSATPVLNGYNPGSANVTLSGDTTQDFALTASSACTAPGYVLPFSADFNNGVPPSGWTVTDDSGSGLVWMPSSAQPFDNGNYTGGTGDAADADSNVAGSTGPYDTSLISPPIPVSILGGATTLDYKANYQEYSGNEALDLDISTDGGATWTTITHWTTDHGSLYGLPGVDVSTDLSSYLPASGDFQLRWRYYNPTSDFDWYAQVDDVHIGSCVPVSGGLVYGQVTDGNTGNGIVGAKVMDDTGASTTTQVNANDPNLPVGAYLFFVPAGARTLTASDSGYADATAQLTVANNQVMTQDFVLNAGRLATNPDHFTLHVMVNTSATAALAVSNTGNADANFNIVQINSPAPSTSPNGAKGAPLKTVKGHFTPVSMLFARSHGGIKPAAAARRPLGVSPNDAPWADIANLPAAIMDNAGATDSTTGMAYTLDGTDGSANLSSVYAYDPNTDSWTAMADSPTAREAPTASYLSGKIYLANGWDASGNPTAELDVYDPATDTWSTATANPVPAAGGSASAVLNGKMYVVGGCNDGGCASPLTAVQVYDPSTDSWSSAADYPQPVTFAMCGGINGKLYCAGGSATNEYANGYVYDPSADSWSPIADIPVASGGLWASSYISSHSELLVSGGVTANFATVTNEGYAYDPTSDTWTALPNSNNTLYRGAGACGFYRIGGSTGGFSPVPNSELLAGYDQCGKPPSIPWLTVAPETGTIAAGDSADVALTFDGTGQEEFTNSQAYLEVTANTPYPTPIVPLDVTWDPQPVALQVTAQADPDPAKTHDYVAFTINVTNLANTGDGAATQAHMTFDLPTGMTYIAQQGDPCVDTSGSMDCTMGTMAQGDTHTMIIVAQTTTKGKYDITFTATAREPQDASVPNTMDLSGRVGKKSSGGGGGIGGFGWLALAGLLGLAMAGVWIRRRRTL